MIYPLYERNSHFFFAIHTFVSFFSDHHFLVLTTGQLAIFSCKFYLALLSININPNIDDKSIDSGVHIMIWCNLCH